MAALVVYESMFGNTEAVALAVAEGLSEATSVQVREVGQAPPAPEGDLALIVAGGPTHVFSMSRASTRADAIKQGADQGSEDVGLREWLDALPRRHPRQKLVTFDTRVAKPHLPGSAAKSAARVARRHGYDLAAAPESFYVRDTSGPLLDGELERARAWGRHLAARLASSPGERRSA